MDASETRRDEIDEIDRSIDRARVVDARATNSGSFPRIVIACGAPTRWVEKKDTNTYLDRLTHVYTSGRNACTPGTKKKTTSVRDEYIRSEA